MSSAAHPRAQVRSYFFSIFRAAYLCPRVRVFSRAPEGIGRSYFFRNRSRDISHNTLYFLTKIHYYTHSVSSYSNNRSSKLIHIALYQPEIPPNTGNIIRLAANTGAGLHLIYPLGFELKDKSLRRAGLDYHEWAHIQHHANFADFQQSFLSNRRIFACSTKGER